MTTEPTARSDSKEISLQVDKRFWKVIFGAITLVVMLTPGVMFVARMPSIAETKNIVQTMAPSRIELTRLESRVAALEAAAKDAPSKVDIARLETKVTALESSARSFENRVEKWLEKIDRKLERLTSRRKKRE